MAEDLASTGSPAQPPEDSRAVLFDLLLDELAERVAKRLRPLVSGGDPGNPPAGSGPLMLDVETAAARLGIAPGALRKKAQRSQIPSVKDGKHLRFRPADLEAYVEGRVRSPEKRAALSISLGGINRLVR
jgi:excisionase family DNA binding protein